MKTVGSRRISSASVSLMASPIVSSRTAVCVSGINILFGLVRGRIGRLHGELHSFYNFGEDFRFDLLQLFTVGDFLGNQPVAEERVWIALRLPQLLFLFGTIVVALDIAHVV